MIRAALCALLLALPLSAFAQADPAAIARRAAAQLDEAAQGLARAEGSRDRVAALSRTIRAYEEGLGALREGLRQAKGREAEIRARFDREQAQLGRLLGALQTMQSGPEALLLLHPSGALGTARSGMILADVTPAMVAEVQELRGVLNELATLRALQASAADTLQSGLAGVQQARADLSGAIQDRTNLPERVTENDDQMQRLLASTQTLEGFASGLATLPEDDISRAMPDFTAAQGELVLPVRGRLIAGFNDPDAAGVRRPGLLLATAPGALVTAPWPATIRYRGPLLDYGNVMILEPAAGYLLVLGGMERVYGETGQVIPSDAPVGVMGGGASPEMASFDADSTVEDGQVRQETLYMELRDGQTPVDPAQWFRLDEE